MWKDYINARTIDQAVSVLAERGSSARIVAGATDLILEMERGVRKGIETLIDVTRIPGLGDIFLDDDDQIHLGPMVTHNDCVSNPLIVQRAFPLAQAAWQVGAPQIRNRGTVAGNLITASPANDTIPPLMAMEASVVLRSQKGERRVPLESFYIGVRQTVMQPDEMMVDIVFPALKENQAGTFLKLGLRRAQAISLVDAAVVLTFAGNRSEKRIEKANIMLGAVAPTIIHAEEAEAYLAGKVIDEETLLQAAARAQEAARPIDDVRSSGDYRREMVRVVALRALRLLKDQNERQDFPEQPVLLHRQTADLRETLPSLPQENTSQQPITTRINGKEYTFTSGHHKTLLRLIREEGGLTGTKEGCAEGECGACTVFLDGMAVMACLVPAPRAHLAEITTVEGLAHDGKLHPVQQMFIEEGAVQCGYCTPGFLMSAAMLLDEKPHPNTDDIRQAITGNLCRCTGYYKIVRAIERASEMEAQDE